jgi:hypothetical protein
MTTLGFAPTTVFVDETSADEDIAHLVCHCSDDLVPWCGVTLDHEMWADDDALDCPLCGLLEDTLTACPWGCTCEDCGA